VLCSLFACHVVYVCEQAKRKYERNSQEGEVRHLAHAEIQYINDICSSDMRQPTIEQKRCTCKHNSYKTGFRMTSRRYRSIATAAAGECGQCHIVSVRR